MAYCYIKRLSSAGSHLSLALLIISVYPLTLRRRLDFQVFSEKRHASRKKEERDLVRGAIPSCTSHIFFFVRHSSRCAQRIERLEEASKRFNFVHRSITACGIARKSHVHPPWTWSCGGGGGGVLVVSFYGGRSIYDFCSHSGCLTYHGQDQDRPRAKK